MRKTILILPMLLFAAGLSACATAEAPAPESTVDCTYRPTGDAATPVDPPPASGVASTGTATLTLQLNDQPMALTLDREQAPCTVNSFESLARQGFFDGSSCHRLVDGGGLYVLQCGDPSGTGAGGPGYQFDDELTGAETYSAGTLAMANAGAGTNGSQFFIVYADSQLAPNYTVFGRTDAAGIETVAQIAAGGQDASSPDGTGQPLLPAVITGVTTG